MISWQTVDALWAAAKLENQLIQQVPAVYGSTRKAANVLKISQASIVRKTKKLKLNKI
ncbi:MAG: hypothetical protein ACYC38_08700 [Eubacteriales bacterium]